MKQPIDRLLERCMVNLHEMVKHGCRDAEKLCESPIEITLLEAMTLRHLIFNGKWPSFSLETFKNEGWLVESQKQIGEYRVDFLVTGSGTKTSIVIECDGHEFHERTKEQAARDRSRDRDLTAQGYRVIRFTGRELWADPWKCATEVEDQIISIWEKELAL